MNCLVLTPHRYGIKEVAERVGRHWERQGHTVEYRLPDGAAARIGNVPVGVPGIARWWQKQFRELKRTGHTYDCIWTHQPLSPTVPDAPFWDRTIITFHTTETAEYTLARDGVYSTRRIPYLWVTSRLEQWFYRRLQSVAESDPIYTVVSPQLRDEIAAFGITDAAYIPNGLAVPDEHNAGQIRQTCSIPADASVLLSVGSHTQQKRPALCARLLNEVCVSNPDLHAVIVGDGPLHDSVCEAATNERVHVRGYVPDEQKWQWLDAADAFISLSAYEGMPVATLEALSAGLPVVLSDIPAHSVLIDQYDGTGQLVPASADAIETAVRELLGTDIRISLPTWDAVATQYLDAVSGESKR